MRFIDNFFAEADKFSVDKCNTVFSQQKIKQLVSQPIGSIKRYCLSPLIIIIVLTTVDSLSILTFFTMNSVAFFIFAFCVVFAAAGDDNISALRKLSISKLSRDSEQDGETVLL